MKPTMLVSVNGGQPTLWRIAGDPRKARHAMRSYGGKTATDPRAPKPALCEVSVANPEELTPVAVVPFVQHGDNILHKSRLLA